MQMDFHYYATYCAAILAGYSHSESQAIAYSAQFVDCCTRTILHKLHGPLQAATTQLQLEMMEARTDLVGLQDITRIWASFHFLPYDLYANPKKRSLVYKNKFRLICNPNGDLLVDTVELAKKGDLQAVGIAMHILADTWAHRYFAGTPSLVINNTDDSFEEIPSDGDDFPVRAIKFVHNPKSPDSIDKCTYTNSVYQGNENSIMNLGHARAGHLPDYSFIKYSYMPAWGGYAQVIKDNPKEYYMAFCQMVYAMKYLRGEYDGFEKDTYAYDVAELYRERIEAIISKRQLIANDDWAEFGEELSGNRIEDFDIEKYQAEYIEAKGEAKNETFLGKFFLAAMMQKSMVTNKIFKSGNLLAGFSVDYKNSKFKGIRDFVGLVTYSQKKGDMKDD